MQPSTAGVRGRHLQVTPHHVESADSWKQLKHQYLSSGLSLRALATEHGASYDALKRRARRERWAAQRAADACTARRRRDLEELAQAREEALRAARNLLALPAQKDPLELARVADELVSAAGMLWKRALHAADPSS